MYLSIELFNSRLLLAVQPSLKTASPPYTNAVKPISKTPIASLPHTEAAKPISNTHKSEIDNVILPSPNATESCINLPII